MSPHASYSYDPYRSKPDSLLKATIQDMSQYLTDTERTKLFKRKETLDQAVQLWRAVEEKGEAAKELAKLKSGGGTYFREADRLDDIGRLIITKKISKDAQQAVDRLIRHMPLATIEKTWQEYVRQMRRMKTASQQVEFLRWCEKERARVRNLQDPSINPQPGVSLEPDLPVKILDILGDLRVGMAKKVAGDKLAQELGGNTAEGHQKNMDDIERWYKQLLEREWEKPEHSRHPVYPFRHKLLRSILEYPTVADEAKPETDRER